MSVMQPEVSSLRDLFEDLDRWSGVSIRSATARAAPYDLLDGSVLGGRVGELVDRSVLLATKDQFTTALALIELDGLARRLVLYPGDMGPAHVPEVIARAEVDAVVCDWDAPEFSVDGAESFKPSDRVVRLSNRVRPSQRLLTEWVLLTSATTGVPKPTVHTLRTLSGAISVRPKPLDAMVWSTFYDIRRYGGLQIFLRALFDGASLVLSSPGEATADFIQRAAADGVTHISGTPTQWRRALMSPVVHRLAPRYVRLSGEIVDQGILDSLRATFPKATIVHAFASTEAGVAFEVRDGRAGFPVEMLRSPHGQVELRIEDGTLRIRSPRTALRYLGGERLAVRDGFVDTRDLVELRNERYYFVGRLDGVINVGGAKVYPEEVEAVLNRHPRVRMSLVKARKNQITGAIVVADVVAEPGPEGNGGGDRVLSSELIEWCQRSLAPYKVPALIRLVPQLEMSTAGKMARTGG
jgi:acyl-CoA synthetase (AMP-forming)/AMP-acid ligase II